MPESRWLLEVYRRKRLKKESEEALNKSKGLIKSCHIIDIFALFIGKSVRIILL